MVDEAVISRIGWFSLVVRLEVLLDLTGSVFLSFAFHHKTALIQVLGKCTRMYYCIIYGIV